jgi:PemK-like, MazF-like toxin of type II toxin-antitoxin system
MATNRRASSSRIIASLTGPSGFESRNSTTWYGIGVNGPPLTTTLRNDADQFRLEVEPSERNGFREVSQIAIDKITVIPVAKIGSVIGEADDALLLRVNRAVALFLSII